jgi:GIY-YIG catalytic domain/NUMOD3 motif
MDDGELQSGIYQIRNKNTGKLYIGSAVDFERRWWMHQSQLRRGVHHSKPLQNSWKKHGEDAFVFEIRERVPEADLLAAEQRHLDEVQPFGKSGYNVAKCSTAPMLGLKLSPESIAKRLAHGTSSTPEFRARMSANNPMHNPEVRQKIAEGLRTPEMRARFSATSTGRRHTPEVRAKMSTNNPMNDPEVRARQLEAVRAPEVRAKQIAASTGRIPSEETRAKLSAAKKGTTHTLEAKAKMSEYAKNRKASPETCAKIAAGNKGKVRTPEMRARYSAAQQRRKEERAILSGQSSLPFSEDEQVA